MAAAFVVLAWPIALDIGLVAGVVGAVVGVLVAETLVARRYRPWVVWGSGLFVIVTGWLIARTVVGSSIVASVLSPVAAIHVGEMFRWFGVASGSCIVLRGTALRYRIALAVEGTVAVAAVVATVAAHRDGQIVYPLAVSDWFWRHGIDPVAAFLMLGLAASLLLFGLLLHGRSRSRAIIQLVIVFVLGLASIFWKVVVPEDEHRNVIGQLQKGEDDATRVDQGSGQQTEGQASGGGSSNSDLPQAGQKGKNRPAAVVIFHRDVAPRGGVFYFRQAAFSQFNGSRLVRSTLPGIDPDGRNDFPRERRDVGGVPEGALGRQEVATDVALITDHAKMFALTDAVEVSPRANPNPSRFRRAYSAISKVFVDDFADYLELPAGDSDWDDRTWEVYTELPRDERYFRLATTLQSRLNAEYNQSPLVLALTIKQYLEETTTYSFSRRYQGDEPTADFLFSEDRKGYCVHLAHSAAYLMRALGLPARVSAGYATEAKNLGGGSALLLKNGDAHAWAELYLTGVGWVPIEITPEKTDVEPSRFQEKELQQLLGEMARREARSDPVTDYGLPVMAWLRAVWASLPWVALGLLLVGYGVKGWRLVAPYVIRQRPLIAYRAALDRLSAVGVVRGHGEPRERFAARLSDVAPSMRPLTAGLSGYVLGSVQPPEVRAGAPLYRLADAVGREVRRATPAWRWILGALNPLSWWWSR